jgi:homoserine O-acetyltransferase
VSPPGPRLGGWREGDDPGRRQFADLGSFSLELGAALPSVRVAYETWGTPAPDRSNAVLVLHALTGDSHVEGPAGPGHATSGWWPGLIGPGAPLDTDRWWVVAPNVLGGCQGTTGPSSDAGDGRAYGSRWPTITIRDQVAVEVALADALGIERWASILGGSMGGMRAAEWAITHPSRVGSLLLLAVGAEATADQIATQTAQVLAITSDPDWCDGDYLAAGSSGPLTGMGVARRIAHLTYRSEQELDARFGRRPQGEEDPLRGGRYAVQSYLDHQAAKLAARFDPGTYVTLTRAMDTHDVGRGRGGLASALASVTAPTVVAGIDSDRLYPLRLQQQLDELLPTSDGLRVVPSPYGHDGFLVEIEAVGKLVTETLALAAAS